MAATPTPTTTGDHLRPPTVYHPTYQQVQSKKMLSWIDRFKEWRYNNRSELRQLGETVSVGFMSMQTLVINFNNFNF